MSESIVRVQRLAVASAQMGSASVEVLETDAPGVVLLLQRGGETRTLYLHWDEARALLDALAAFYADEVDDE